METEAAAMWRSILDKTAHGLDLDTGEGQVEFSYLAKDALRDLPLDVLQGIAESVGALTSPLSEAWVTDAIIRNFAATARGRGTDVDVDAHTHCTMCRAPYRRLPARAESLWIPRLVCTDDACGFCTAVLGPDGLPLIEKPEPVPPPRTRRQRLALWVHPYTGPVAFRVPPMREALEARAVETIGSLLDPVAPVLRRTGWKAVYFAASRAHRAAASVRRRATRAEKAIAEVAIWASYGVDDREGKDGQL